MNPAIWCPTPREVEMKVEDRREMSPDSGRRPRDSGSRVSRRAWRHQSDTHFPQDRKPCQDADRPRWHRTMRTMRTMHPQISGSMAWHAMLRLPKRNQVVGQFTILIDLGEKYVPNYIGVFEEMCNSTLEPELRTP